MDHRECGGTLDEIDELLTLLRYNKGNRTANQELLLEVK